MRWGVGPDKSLKDKSTTHQREPAAALLSKLKPLSTGVSQIAGAFFSLSKVKTPPATLLML